MASKWRISFLICSWRAPASLDATLNSISRQPNSELYETILVNNGFTDEREAFFVKTYPQINLTIIKERTLGQGHARCAGFNIVAGEIIVMLDDDNTLSDDFVPRLLELLDKYPQVGGICPVVLPEWETIPPSWLQDFGTLCLSYTAKNLSAAPDKTRYWGPAEAAGSPRPPGGGMIIHRDVAHLYLASVTDPERRALARTGKHLIACEDYDIYSHLRLTGRGALETPQLVIYHHIHSARIRLPYLLRLNYWMLYSYIRLDFIFLNPRRISLAKELWGQLIGALGSLKNGLIHRKHPAEILCYLSRHAGSVAGYLSVAFRLKT